MTTVQERVGELDRSTFFGVPIAEFENRGRQQLILLIMAGLQPASRVVDLGCGLLRGGYWLIHFLEPDCYHGIEPHEGRLDVGRNIILEQETIAAKRPHFDANANFDTGVFGQKFDFFLAYSIWTHAAKPQIELMLDQFMSNSTPKASFLRSILPAGWGRSDYQGERWFGTSHEDDVAGCIHHDLKWIEEQCQRRGLYLLKLGQDRGGQTWLSISRNPKASLLFKTIWADPLRLRAARRLRSLWRRWAKA
jgi:hypothetical protein